MERNIRAAAQQQQLRHLMLTGFNTYPITLSQTQSPYTFNKNTSWPQLLSPPMPHSSSSSFPPQEVNLRHIPLQPQQRDSSRQPQFEATRHQAAVRSRPSAIIPGASTEWETILQNAEVQTGKRLELLDSGGTALSEHNMCLYLSVMAGLMEQNVEVARSFGETQRLGAVRLREHIRIMFPNIAHIENLPTDEHIQALSILIHPVGITVFMKQGSTVTSETHIRGQRNISMTEANYIRDNLQQKFIYIAAAHSHFMWLRPIN